MDEVLKSRTDDEASVTLVSLSESHLDSVGKEN